MDALRGDVRARLAGGWSVIGAVVVLDCGCLDNTDRFLDDFTAFVDCCCCCWTINMRASS